MASFRFHGARWQARVRRQGHPEVTRSFINKNEAERWARSVESEMDKGLFVETQEAQRTTLRELIHRYPFLLNSDTGSTSVSTQCQSFNNGKSTYSDVVWFEETIKLASYLSKGELFGFAIPLNSGQFKVARFRLKGATEAIGRATNASSRRKIGDSRL